MRNPKRRLETDEIYPDLPIRRAIRNLATNHKANPEHLSQVHQKLGRDYQHLPPAKAIERFSFLERRMERLKKIHELIESLSTLKSKTPKNP